MRGYSASLVTVLFLVLLTVAPVMADVTTSADLQKQEIARLYHAWKQGATLSDATMEMLQQAGLISEEPSDPVIDDFGGPDFAGHLWLDSNEPDGPVFSWVGIEENGVNIADSLSDDGRTGPIDIGFNFQLYDNTYTQLYVQANGGITFEDVPLTYNATDLPYNLSGTDDSMIAWVWCDLNIPGLDPHGDVYYETITIGERQAFVLSYVDVPEFNWDGVSDRFTGQVLLFDDGEVLIQFQEFEDGFDVTRQTIGIQNDDDTDYLQVISAGTQYVENELAIKIYLADPDATLSGTVTNEGSGTPVENAEVHVGPWETFTNAQGEYSVETLYAGRTYDIEIRGPNHYTFYGSTTMQLGANTYDVAIDPFPAPYNGSYATDFEGGQGLFDWVEGADWEYGTPTFWPVGAYSGDNALSTILSGSYNNSRDDWMIMTETFLIGDVESYLTYWHWFNYASNQDGYNVQVSTDGMETWELLLPNSGYSDFDGIAANGMQGCWNNTGPGAGTWTQVTYDLGMYLDQQIWLAFRHSTDEEFNVYSGVTIDDLEVNVGTPPTGLGLELIGQVVVVPPAGGTVVFDATITSTLPSPMTLDAWTFVTTPNGSTIGPIFDLDVMIPPGVQTIVGLPQSVPAYAPGGEYTYAAYIGLLPGTVGASDSFTFSKIGVDPDGGGSWTDETWATKMNGQQIADAATAELPDQFLLSEAYPNPFNPSTSLQLSLPQASDVTVNVYNVMGQEVATIASGRMSAGVHTLTFDAHDMASGVYFVRAEIPGHSNLMQKVMLVR